jgi:hypothetical protein
LSAIAFFWAVGRVPVKGGRFMLKVWVATICVSLASTSIFAQEWRAHVERLLAIPTESERDSLIALIVAAGPPWREVAAEITSRTFSDTTKGCTLSDSALCADGIVRAYAVYVPTGYDAGTPSPLLVHLHGIVNRPRIEPDPSTYVGNAAIMAAAEQQGWLVLFPFGQEGATWFDDVGMAHVMDLVRTIKIRFNVDDDHVCLSGLSDGASAAFLFAMILPDGFAAFVALNGSMGVGSENGGFSTYAPNLANSYVFATTADHDRYYPTSQMERTIAMAEKAGARMVYRRLAGEHISSIANFDYAELLADLERHPRNPRSDTVVWETATPEFGQCRWLAIDEITIDEPAAWHTEHNVALVDSSLSIGFQPDPAFPGPGVMVASLSEGDVLSRRMGLAPGDILVQGNGVPIDSLSDLNRFKATLNRGSEVTLTIRRGAGTVMRSGRVPAPRNYLVFRRDKPSALARAVYADNRFDIQGSRVGALRLLIGPSMVDLDRDLTATFNGEKIWEATVSADIGYMLRDFLAHRDRKWLVVNEVCLRPAR